MQRKSGRGPRLRIRIYECCGRRFRADQIIEEETGLEYVEGMTLKEYLLSYAWREDGTLDSPYYKVKEGFEETLMLLAQLTDTIAYLHTGGIIHRDLKPENVLVSLKEKHVKLLDFGSVRDNSEGAKKLTVIGTTIGSPLPFSSPNENWRSLN